MSAVFFLLRVELGYLASIKVYIYFFYFVLRFKKFACQTNQQSSQFLRIFILLYSQSTAIPEYKKFFYFMLGQQSFYPVISKYKKNFFWKNKFFQGGFCFSSLGLKIYQVVPVFTTNFLSVCLSSGMPSMD